MTEQAVPAPRRALIVANPTAGTTSARLVDEVFAFCSARLADVRVHRTTRRGDATAAVRAACGGRTRGPAPDLVMAVGGDGTVHEVVDGLTGADGADGTRDRESAAALFIVPAGTGNSGYKMFWGERPWQEALAEVAAGARGGARRYGLDLALLEETGAKVFLGACTGVIADALRVARSIPLSGRERYTRAFAESAAAFTPYPGRVTVDGTVLHEGPAVLANVGGGRHRGGRYLVLPRSELDDGLLDVCVIGGEVEPARVPELTRRAEHLGLPGVRYGRGRRVVVERLDGEPLCFEHDGDLQPAGLGRITLQVLPGALPVWGDRAGRLTDTVNRE